MPRALSACLAVLLLTGCAVARHKPCTDGGDAPREKPIEGNKIDKKQCTQEKDRHGKLVNQGSYKEWFFNGRLALEGEYRDGKRHGKWFEYDEAGKIVSERWFEDGKETATRTNTQPVNSAPAQLPAATQPKVSPRGN